MTTKKLENAKRLEKVIEIDLKLINYVIKFFFFLPLFIKVLFKT